MTLEKAIAIASKAHEMQLDKGGEPYILHPLRVMMTMTSYEGKIVAMLHDVLEDTELTLDVLRAKGFSEKILDCLDLLTHRESDSYEAYIGKILENPLATQVKIADLKDNMDWTRLKKLTDTDFQRLEKYFRAYQMLTHSKK